MNPFLDFWSCLCIEVSTFNYGDSPSCNHWLNCSPLACAILVNKYGWGQCWWVSLIHCWWKLTLTGFYSVDRFVVNVISINRFTVTGSYNLNCDWQVFHQGLPSSIHYVKLPHQSCFCWTSFVDLLALALLDPTRTSPFALRVSNFPKVGSAMVVDASVLP